MADWRSIHYAKNDIISLSEFLTIFISKPQKHIAIAVESDRISTAEDELLQKLLSAIRQHNLIFLFFANCAIESWLHPVFLSSDLAFCTNSTSLSFHSLSGTVLENTAMMISEQLGKAQGMELLLDENIKLEKIVAMGLIARIISESEFVDFEAYRESLLSDVKIEAMIQLKQALSSQRNKTADDAFAIERNLFAQCFETGGSEAIMDYLQKRFNSKS